MNELLRRIAIHGGITALFLGVLGLVLAEIAGVAYLAPAGTRSPDNMPGEGGANAEALTREMRRTIPLRMAILGFGIVAIVEVLRHFLRGGRKPVAPPPPPPPDETEKLLEELLTQAESRAAATPSGGESPPATPIQEGITPSEATK